MTAEIVRNTVPSSPMANPIVATNSPIAVNDSANPAASSQTPARPGRGRPADDER